MPDPQAPGVHQRRPLSQQAHRRLIGILGLLLPLLLYLVAGLRPTPPLRPWTPLDSVSAYYYTGAIAIFVGILFALSLFLLTYGGYEGEMADRIVGRVAGTGALGVALFPTSAPLGLFEPPWWRPAFAAVHYVSAVVLFVGFILFSTWLFRKSSVPPGHRRPIDKQWRDAICLSCGVLMIICVSWAGSSLFTHAPIVLPESIAIVAFAVSWLTKGEIHKGVAAAYHRLRHGT